MQLYLEHISYHNHLLYFGDSFPKNRPQLVSDASQQESKQWDPQQSVDYAEYPSSLCVRRYVPKS